MPKTIPVIFAGDVSIDTEKRKAYTKFVNETLSDLRKEILIDKGHLKVISKNKINLHIAYDSDNEKLKKNIESRLSVLPFQYI